MWVKVAQFSLAVLVTAVGKITPAQWAQLGVVLQAWLTALEGKLPAGHPLVKMLDAYRSKVGQIKADLKD